MKIVKLNEAFSNNSKGFYFIGDKKQPIKVDNNIFYSGLCSIKIYQGKYTENKESIEQIEEYLNTLLEYYVPTKTNEVNIILHWSNHDNFMLQFDSIDKAKSVIDKLIVLNNTDYINVLNVSSVDNLAIFEGFYGLEKGDVDVSTYAQQRQKFDITKFKKNK